ncbi:probable dolichyl pyrophosphate Man9GlcNAc2 alpha-1,3-glucosyltransferase isoform X2 [Cornus florida]|uniref:probable dolichyl pyrophosphate Man9GlcNAc2 alpha-1,3-glucosyltransferase isoform X2 n=1 Tax=Cornus florida TaxID=4283 RepID=UPI00289F69C1|nr:probable dolichyl pyrophosphate Man9GlcNAc2 alpha-1,3-glucosyltransferase isoform X2 [Cornus florida]
MATLKDGEGDDNNIWGWLVHKGIAASFLCISLFALLVRVAVSIHPYSGAGNPPMYGDFEAQRHWMEITVNLPAKEWYHNSTVNDLSYWGLDYPPLTAYQSYVHGLLLRFFHPDSVLLYTSRGHESYLGKLLMRWTALSSDALIFFPAVLYYVIVCYSGRPNGRKINLAWHITMILLSPCLILIDHGHFQMTAYFAPAFFSYLLGKCLRGRYPLLEVLKLGMVVVGTFAFVWWPYLHSMDAFLEVLSRLAPFERGIYEDYVANFWCTTSVLIKWKRLYTVQSMKLLSLGATVISCLPSMIQQIRAPSNQGFLYGLLNSSFSFYLFSFQVHEKSILLPLLPASLLALKEPFLFSWITHYALLSMFPLLCRDKLVLPYIALFALFFLLYYAPGGRQDTRSMTDSHATLKSFVMAFLVLCSFILHIVYLTMRPPEKYPFLFEALIMLLCFSQFMLLAIYTNTKQWMLSKQSILLKEKKHL